MAKPLPLTLPERPQLELIITKRCPNCKDPISTHDGLEYIYSKVTDSFYCDMVCMAKAEGKDINYLERKQCEAFMDEMEAEYRP